MSEQRPVEGRDIPHIGHGDFRPANMPAGSEGLVSANPHQPEGRAAGAIPNPWAGAPPEACSRTTKAGNPCKMPPLAGHDYCVSHNPARTSEV